VADGYQIKERRVGWSEVEAEFGENGARVVACVWRGGGGNRWRGVEKIDVCRMQALLALLVDTIDTVGRWRVPHARRYWWVAVSSYTAPRTYE
jgi:hypothetical protein